MASKVTSKTKARSSKATKKTSPKKTSTRTTKATAKSPKKETAKVVKLRGNEPKEVRRLLERGQAKGFLTFDEINDGLPPDLVSSDQIDELMSLLTAAEIQVVDSPARYKPPVPKEQIADEGRSPGSEFPSSFITEPPPRLSAKEEELYQNKSNDSGSNVSTENGVGILAYP